MIKISDVIKKYPKNLRKAFVLGLNAKKGAKNPYKDEVKQPNGKATYSRAFINAWYSGFCYKKHLLNENFSNNNTDNDVKNSNYKQTEIEF